MTVRDSPSINLRAPARLPPAIARVSAARAAPEQARKRLSLGGRTSSSAVAELTLPHLRKAGAIVGAPKLLLFCLLWRAKEVNVGPGVEFGEVQFIDYALRVHFQLLEDAASIEQRVDKLRAQRMLRVEGGSGDQLV